MPSQLEQRLWSISLQASYHENPDSTAAHAPHLTDLYKSHSVYKTHFSAVEWQRLENDSNRKHKYGEWKFWNKYDVKIKTNNLIKNRATTDIVKILYYITSTQ